MENKSINKARQTDRAFGKGHTGFKHLGMMAVCCLVPLIAALLLKQLGYSGIANYLILFLCPILHLFMMRGMFTNQAEPQVHSKNQNHPGDTRRC